MMRTKAFLFALSAVFTASLFLAACDEAEQGRILRYEEGVYLGKADQSLTTQQLDELRARTRMQQAAE